MSITALSIFRHPRSVEKWPVVEGLVSLALEPVTTVLRTVKNTRKRQSRKMRVGLLQHRDCGAQLHCHHPRLEQRLQLCLKRMKILPNCGQKGVVTMQVIARELGGGVV
jgi:hypothetical protein